MSSDIMHESNKAHIVSPLVCVCVAGRGGGGGGGVVFLPVRGSSLTFESVDEILKCDHSNESNWAVLFNGAVYYAVQERFEHLSL